MTTRAGEPGGFRRGLRSLALGSAMSALWPTYLLLLAYVARQAPWPRSMSILGCSTLIGLALALFVHELIRWATRPAGWAEHYLGMPGPLARQLGRAGRFATAAAAVLVLPAYLIDNGLILPDGRTLGAPAFSRFLVLAFEVVLWGAFIHLLRARSALMASLALEPEGESATDGSRIQAGLAWVSRRRRWAAIVMVAAFGAIIVLDVRGYSYSARRLAVAGLQTAVLIALGVAAYRAAARAIDRHVGRWARPRRRRNWAVAITSAMARRAAGHSRRDEAADRPAPASADDPAQTEVSPADLAAGLRKLAGAAIAGLGVLAIAWLWELDLAFVRFLLGQSLWSLDEQTSVTVGDIVQAGAFLVAGVLLWRYMTAIFTLTLFHRMPDDPGVRFAVVTLCRYAVLAITAFAALSAVRLDMARISVVLAALGVGLGFGLQEIISNFVCGIILLLERPIRIGDVVTVADTTGRVDRIHIRATTIVNGDNQSMIVPNRQFITGNLVNWTHKDKILRITIKLGVAYGSDPDEVSELLLSVARRDPDVVMSPAPAAMMEGFGDSALLFVLYAHVPDPGLIGTARHRMCAEIQRRFAEAGIDIPYPIREVRLSGLPAGREEAALPATARHDGATVVPPEPHARVATPVNTRVGERD